jgi:hypothetical protein
MRPTAAKLVIALLSKAKLGPPPPATDVL